MKKKNMLILLILLLTVGFASISTTIVLNGTIGIATKPSDFNVAFKSATVNGNSAVKATISEDKKTITFETDKLSAVGDSAELVYKVKNDSTQYDANVTVSCTGGNEEYLSIQGEFAGKSLPLTEPELMQAQEIRMGVLSVSISKAYDASVTKVPITCTLVIEGKERDSIVEHSVCEFANGIEWTFDYTGSEQEFVVPCDGEYKLETWGASGGDGSSTYIGGYGAYATGNISLLKNSPVFIYVGQKGYGYEYTLESEAKVNYDLPVVYNNNKVGGNYWSHGTLYSYEGMGGGATHIATTNKTIDTIDKSTLYIVAGGGGGGANYYTSSSDRYLFYGYGGHAGGIQGNDGTGGGNYMSNSFPGTGGTQTSPGISINNETYSTGGSGYFYGGDGSRAGSGGGSSYIGNSLLTNKSMYCYNCTESTEESTKTISTTCTSLDPTVNCAKQGNGYAKITLVSAEYPKVGSTWNFDYTGGVQEFKVPYDGEYKLETWGAQGGTGWSESHGYNAGGKGGYSSGVVSLYDLQTLFVYVGQKGPDPVATSYGKTIGGYNGGGGSGNRGTNERGGTGGGATDISLYTSQNNDSSSFEHLYSRLIVAGGGGGGDGHGGTVKDLIGGYGGGLTGQSGLRGGDGHVSYGGTQVSGGLGTHWAPDGNISYVGANSGTFGIGGNIYKDQEGSGGGGGWYGGGASTYAPAGGGSGWIYNSVNYSNWLNNSTEGVNKLLLTENLYLKDSIMKNGSEVMPTHDGTSTMVGNTGNGYAKITLISAN